MAATALATLLLALQMGCWGRVQSLRTARRSFVIKNDQFLKDGKRINVKSGSVHYSRVPRAYWRDRLERAKALGLNAVTTYVPWNFHEDVEGRFDFAEDRDVYAFADEVRKLDLLLILRVGPYMCGEWDFGGFPAWLLGKANMTVRTHNKPYLDAVDKFWDHLLPRFKRRLYSNGGPIVMVCVEIKILRRVRADRRVVLHAIDATPARWRGGTASSPLNGAGTAASSPRNDLMKKCSRRTG